VAVSISGHGAQEFGSFDAFIWRFVGGRPRRNLGKKVPASRRVRRNEQGAKAARLHLRQFDDLLRLHAGSRNGERSRLNLLPLLADSVNFGKIRIPAERESVIGRALTVT